MNDVKVVAEGFICFGLLLVKCVCALHRPV